MIFGFANPCRNPGVGSFGKWSSSVQPYTSIICAFEGWAWGSCFVPATSYLRHGDTHIQQTVLAEPLEGRAPHAGLEARCTCCGISPAFHWEVGLRLPLGPPSLVTSAPRHLACQMDVCVLQSQQQKDRKLFFFPVHFMVWCKCQRLPCHVNFVFSILTIFLCLCHRGCILLQGCK